MLVRLICLSMLMAAILALELASIDSDEPAGLQKAGSLLRNSADIINRQQALWPGARYTEEDRARAIYRGLNFIYRTASNHRNFAEHGQDYLWCFDTTAKVMKDSTARRMALSMGVQLARRWRRGHRSIPRSGDAGTVAIFAFADDSAEGLGVVDHATKEKIKRAAARFSARDFLDFDPTSEPPPSDVPEECARCGRDNARGRRVCSACVAPLKMRSRYDVWSGALITTWRGDHYGVRLGASYADVLRWLPIMRPYRGRDNGDNREFSDIVYAVTHVVYTLNDYSKYKLSPAWLPQEFEFLKSSLKESITMEDPDMLGEFMDSLRSFGLTDDDPLIQTGIEYLLSHQNPDGSWGHMPLRYHPTWAAIDGLSDYTWRGEGLSFPALKPLLEQWAAAPE